MSAQSLDYVIMLSQGFIIALLGYSFVTQGRNLIQSDRVKNATQTIITGVALALVGFIIGIAAAILLISNK